jgi:putative Mn2+ efflux pump MntP
VTLRIIVGNNSGVLEWITYVVLISITIGTVILLAIEMWWFVRRLLSRRKEGYTLDPGTVKRGLIIAWLLSLLFRVAASDDSATPAEWTSVALLGLFTIALTTFSFWQDLRRSSAAGHALEPVAKYLLIIIGLSSLILAPNIAEGPLRSLSLWLGTFCLLGLIPLTIYRRTAKRNRSASGHASQGNI